MGSVSLAEAPVVSSTAVASDDLVDCFDDSLLQQMIDDVSDEEEEAEVQEGEVVV